MHQNLMCRIAVVVVIAIVVGAVVIVVVVVVVVVVVAVVVSVADVRMTCTKQLQHRHENAIAETDSQEDASGDFVDHVRGDVFERWVPKGSSLPVLI